MKLAGAAQEIFLAALAKPESGRAQYIKTATNGNAGLFAEVSSLLAAAESADAYFDNMAANVSLSALADDDEIPNDLAFGPFRVTRLLGRGGMGAVYLAERADGEYEQQVAIKTLPFGFSSQEARERFARERRILAQLQHNNIARLVDGGVSDDGTPYFVMDYVDGQPIDEYCRERQLPVRERLALIIRVARAVQFAHQNLIVHRDLKPGNVMVDRDGAVKLLDFGIAKTLADDEAIPLTRTGLGPMTSRYASPEMLRGEPVTTLSDVYSLGVLVYELLAGVHPYAGVTTTQAVDLWHAVCEQDPVAPSKALVNRLATSGRTSVAPSEVRGDLDKIIQKAMAKSPDERYATVGEFVDDIERHLKDLPILAQAPSFAERVTKFVRRRKVLVAAMIVGFGFLISTLYQARQIAIESERANREAFVASQVSDFLVGLFEEADPRQSQGNEPTVRDALQRGAAAVSKDSIEDPEVRGRLLSTIGQTQERLAVYDEAEATLIRARDTLEAELGSQHRLTMDAERRLGSVYIRQGRFADAEQLLAESLQRQQRVLGATDDITLNTTNNLAIAHAQQGQFVEAARLVSKIVAYRRSSLGLEHEETINSIHNLAIFERLKGNMVNAEALFVEILEPQLEVVGIEHPNTMGLMQNLADLYLNQGRYTEAVPLYEQAEGIARRVLGDEHTATLRLASNFANLYQEMGDYETALGVYTRAMPTMRRVLGATHPETLVCVARFAELKRRLELYDGAEELAQEAVEGFRKSLGAEHPSTLNAQETLVRVLVAKGNADEAAVLAQSILDTRVALAERADATVQQLLAATNWALDAVPASIRDQASARRFALRAQESSQSPEASVWFALGRAEAANGNIDAAEAALNAAIEALHPGAEQLRSTYEEELQSVRVVAL